MGCSPWGCEESDTTEQLSTHTLKASMGHAMAGEPRQSGNKGVKGPYNRMSALPQKACLSSNADMLICYFQ